MPSIQSTNTEAHVNVSKVKTQEYSVQVDGALKKASCFVESVESKPFEICLRTDIQTVACKVLLDGEEQAVQLVRAGEMCTIRGRSIVGNQLVPFQFTKIALTDDDDEACQSEQVVKNLGTIVLEVRRVVEVGYSNTPSRSYDAPTARSFDEKSKKAQLAQTAGFGAAEYSAPGASVACNWIDPNHGPAWCTYTFTYRDNDFLEIHGHKQSTARPARAVDTDSPQPQAGPSRPNKRPALEASGSRSKSPKETDDQKTIRMLREENARLKRVKVEGGIVKKQPVAKKEPPAKKKTEIIELSDSD